MNPLRALQNLGQSVWLDDIRRQYLDDGTLAELIGNDGVSGVTSNPAIFERAVRESAVYDASIAVAMGRGATAVQVYEQLVLEDLQRAADLLRPCYDRSAAVDGYVSLEVNPRLAYDTEATIAEARRWWVRVARPNLMIKVPATLAGIPAIRELISTGINVNVTLLFGQKRYRSVVDAYWAGLEHRVAADTRVDRVVSVASFFVSRIDAAVDRLLEAGSANDKLRGLAAITAAANAYQVYLDTRTESRWQALERHGAQPQRLLWASTGAKERAYSDIKYVEALIERETVTTLPMETLQAYREHGDPRARLNQAVSQVDATRRRLHSMGIELDTVAEHLECEGVAKFIDAYDSLLARLESRRQKDVG
jgi:transaldolase